MKQKMARSGALDSLAAACSEGGPGLKLPALEPETAKAATVAGLAATANPELSGEDQPEQEALPGGTHDGSH
jgi:hypothetical protein